MRKAIAISHVDFEDLGSLAPALERADYAVEVIHACSSDLHTIDPKSDLLVVLGGPIGVYQQAAYPFLKSELDLIQSRLMRQRPTLGICLGAQLIAAAAGASVHPGTQGKELGWAPIHAGRDAADYPEFAPLFAHDLRVLHWHGDTFDLPPGSSHLAGTSTYPNQAFAIGRHTLGLQFHLEVTAPALERWYVGHAGELSSIQMDIPKLRRQSETFAPALEQAAHLFWDQWLAQL